MKFHQYIDLSAFKRRGATDTLSGLQDRAISLGAEADSLAAHSTLASAIPLSPRDEAVLLLTAAAEIEHALMVQYLFAAYSLDPAGAAPSHTRRVEELQRSIAQIAREEMGHLITVQNLLLVMGAPLHFDRDHSPHTSKLHPFRFKLERLTLGSLAKYVIAESPDLPPVEIEMLSAARKKLLADEIEPSATRHNDGQPVQHVGPLFARLLELFTSEVADDDFRLDRQGFQANWSDWGYDSGAPRSPGSKTQGGRVLVDLIDADNPVEARQQILGALKDIGDQGEYPDSGDELDDSHFDRFIAAYEMLKTIEGELERPVTWPVVRFPNTSRRGQNLETLPLVDAMLEAPIDSGRITHERTLSWARLFNLRYRLLLNYLMHVMLLEGAHYVEIGDNKGDRTPKGVLGNWAFQEMIRVKKLAKKLVTMPATSAAGSKHAGPPFELPFTLQLPAIEADRWRTHADVIKASEALILHIKMSYSFDEDDPFLSSLLVSDAKTKMTASAIAASNQVPTMALPKGFKKVVTSLEEAVRGVNVADFGGFHGNFWAGVNRDEFISGMAFPAEIIPGDPENSDVLRRVISRPPYEGGMPKDRPELPKSRQDFIIEWVADGAQDDHPPRMIGVATAGMPKDEPRKESSPPNAEPTEADQVTYITHIKPLFRLVDRNCMLSWFDLHDFDDVKDNADLILRRLEDGTMPMDQRWPDEDIELFRAWAESGRLSG